MADQNDIFDEKGRGQSADDSLFGTNSRADEDDSPIQVVNPYGGDDQPVQEDAPQVAQPANPYAQPAEQPAGQSANPYIAVSASQGQAVNFSGGVSADSAQAGFASAQSANPYQQAYGSAASDATSQAANPYGASQPVGQGQPGSPYQQPAGAAGAVGGAAAPGGATPYGQPAGQSASPYGQAAGSYGQPATPYGQPAAPYGQPSAPYGQPYPGSAAAPASTGKATGALVCGILAILLSGSVVLSIILGIVAIVLAGGYLKEGGTAGTAKAGRICGIVGIVFSAISLVIYIMFGVALYQVAMDEIESGSYPYGGNSPSAIVGSSGSISSDIYDDAEKAAASVVTAELDKIKAGDQEVLTSIAELAEEGFAQATGVTMADCGIDSMEYARLMTEGFNYEVTMVLADEETGGFVACDLTCRDIFDVIDEFNDSLDDFVSSTAATSLSSEQAQARVGELFMEAVREADMEHDSYFSVDVSYENGKWVMSQEDWDSEIDYYFGLY